MRSPVSLWLFTLAASGLALIGLALVTARPVAAIPDRAGYFDRWQELHGGYDPRGASIWVRGWLSMVYAIARPLARRGVLPDVVTASSLWFGALVPVLTAAGGHWPVAAAWLLVASGLVDNLDGCVAVLEDRTSAWGYVLDSAVDRVSDALYLIAMVVLGCPVGLAAGLGFAVFFLEYVRARAGNAGGDEVGRITVAERPTRVLVLAPTLLAAGAVPSEAGDAALLGSAVLLALTVVGIGQLVVAVRRHLLAIGPR